MLHIVNGDATLRIMAAAGLDGEFAVWRDALMEGPAPNALRTKADWEERAARNATDWGISRDAYLAGVGEFHARVEKGDPEEVVLWFEDDLFCQLPLCYLLARPRAGAAPWSVICGEERLGEQRPEPLRVLYAARRRPTPGMERLAAQAWDAYGASDPSALAALVADADAFAPWPLLRRGLLAHLGRFPAVGSGLSSVEAATLEMLRGGPLPFRSLFARLNPTPLFRTIGAGEMQLATLVAALASCPSPLLRLDGASARDDVLERVAASRIEITATGEAVLAGRQDHVALNPPDRWVGGVHLAPGRRLWRWDAARAALIAG